jgi:S-adenosylmethionine hydrolase
MYCRLTNGFEIMAVNSGYVFSFVKPHIERFHYAAIPNEGSQFRSRDIYPRAVAQMIKGDAAFVGKQEKTSVIPDFPGDVIASIDGYGNLKTTMRQSEVHFKPGETIQITINKKKHIGTFTDGFFHIAEGELSFFPGSSGHSDKFMEISVRGGSAWRLFDKPDAEATFTATKV